MLRVVDEPVPDVALSDAIAEEMRLLLGELVEDVRARLVTAPAPSVTRDTPTVDLAPIASDAPIVADAAIVTESPSPPKEEVAADRWYAEVVEDVDALTDVSSAEPTVSAELAPPSPRTERREAFVEDSDDLTPREPIEIEDAPSAWDAHAPGAEVVPVADVAPAVDVDAAVEAPRVVDEPPAVHEAPVVDEAPAVDDGSAESVDHAEEPPAATVWVDPRVAAITDWSFPSEAIEISPPEAASDLAAPVAEPETVAPEPLAATADAAPAITPWEEPAITPADSPAVEQTAASDDLAITFDPPAQPPVDEDVPPQTAIEDAPAESLAPEAAPVPDIAPRQISLVLSPVRSFPHLLEIQRRVESLSSVRGLQLRDFRNGIATFAVAVAEAISPREFGAVVQMIESLHLRLEGASENSVELRVDAEGH